MAWNMLAISAGIRMLYPLYKDYIKDRQRRRVALRLEKQIHKVDMLNAKLLAYQAGEPIPEGN